MLASPGRATGGLGEYSRYDRKVLDLLDDDTVFEGAPLDRLARSGELMVHRHDGFWFSVDTFRDYQEINRMWDQGHRPWKRW